MKKIFTLLFSIGAFASSFAQSNHQQGDSRFDNKKDDQYVMKTQGGDSYDRRYDDRRMNDTYVFTAQQRDFEIAKINHDFDSRVSSIKRNFLMGRRQKNELIQTAERQRSQQIQVVYAKFSSSKNQFSDFSGGHDKKDKDWRH